MRQWFRSDYWRRRPSGINGTRLTDGFPKREREGLSLFALSIIGEEGRAFQERLENAAFQLISENSL